jgi:hypothetical protein
MKTKVLFSALTLLAGSLIVADASPKEEVSAAATALAGKVNYSWTQTVTMPEGSPFTPGPTDGKTEKDGYTSVTSSFGENKTEVIVKGGKTVINSPDNGWQTLEELQNDQGQGRFMAMMAGNVAIPAVQATNLVDLAKAITKDGDAYVSDLSEGAAKALLSMRRRGGPGGGAAPEIADAKGSVKFWIKDGVLAKYELKVSGKMSINGEDRDMSRTTTVEVKDVGTTKIEVPDGAKKKLNPEPAPAAK